MDKESRSQDGDMPALAGTGAASPPARPELEDPSPPILTNAAAWILPRPFSRRDVIGSLILFGVAITLWYVGDFHSFHYSDNLIHSLNSLYRWTPLSWESDHIGSLLSLLVSWIRRPYWNVLALSSLSSLLFLGGLTLWAGLLAPRNTRLIECAIWVLLLLPLVVDKHRIFDNASHGSTFGSAFFFAGLFVHGLVNYLQKGPDIRRLFGLFVCGFLTVYLSKTVLIPLGIVTLCLSAQQIGEQRGRWDIRSLHILSGPAICLAFALLVYTGLEITTPRANIYGMSLSNIPVSLPALFTNWSAQELTTPGLVAVPVLLLLYKPANRILNFLAAGILLETIVIASTGWVINYHLSGYYLTDLTFLLLLTLVLLSSQFVRRLTPPRWYPTLLPILASVALLLNTQEWKSFSPNLPFTAMDRSIGLNTASIVEADCDILIGDYWKIWPPVLAANDYYFRSHMIDPRTGETRVLAAISLRAAPIEYLWRPRLEWPDAKLCGLAGDEAERRSYLTHYAPDRALFLVEGAQYDNVITYVIRNQHLTEFNLEFDIPTPGEGWSYPEITPAGDTFVWMDATTSTLYLPLATEHSLDIEFRVIMSMAPDLLQSLNLRVNDQLVPLTAIADGDGSVVYRARVSPSVLAANADTTVLTLHINRLLVPQLTMPGSIDHRSLGLAFDWLRIR